MQNLEKNTVGFEFNKINVSDMNMIVRIYLFCDIEIRFLFLEVCLIRALG